METTRIKLKDLELNTGQVAGLPRNPRQWSKGDVQRLAKSITETPELLEARPLIAIPCKGRYVVLGGNLRLEALRSLKWAEAPVYLLPENTTLEKQREIVIKDNGSFGQWDVDTLANEWEAPFYDWGVDVGTDVDKEVERVKKDKELLGRVPFTEILKEEHNYIVLYFDNEVDWLQAQTLFQLKPVKALPTTKAGEQSLAFQKRIGVGRVINGAKAIENLLADMEGRK